MRVGLALPQYDSSVPGEHPLRWPALARWARTADQLGFQSLWLSDHLFIDTAHFGVGPGRTRPLDALPALAAVARVTERARLGTLVLCAPLRPPTIVAKALATLDVISGGRVIAGLGAGWFEPEFRDAGVAFGSPAERLAQVAGAIETLRRTWAGEGPPCRPPPVHPLGPPIWVGGRGERLLQLTGRLADGWNTGWTCTLADFRTRSAVIDRACEAAGRDPASVTRSVGLHVLVGEDRRDLDRRFERLAGLAPPDIRPIATLARWRHGHLVGTVDEVRQQLDDWAGAGADELIVNPGGLPFHAVHIDDLPLIAQACSLET
jgi:alkanesulfonate monooxygenase SsuD/methylene tetrahydromethanopterin reductase-like flavin-dependent oxidoreductase (luciferase family)